MGADVWELSTQARQLEPLGAEAAEHLKKQRQYCAELRHALRQLRDRSSGGGGNGPWGFSGSARGIEDELGHGSAQAWTSFMRALLACPRAVPAVAHAAGYQSYGFLANLVVALTEDPMLFAMQGGEGLSWALEEVLDFEFDALVPADTVPHIPDILSD